MSNQVLLVDDDRSVREALGQSLSLANYSVITAASFVEAKDHIREAFEGIVVSDIRMPGKDGFELLAYANSMDPDLPVILLTGEGDIPMAVRGMSEGAFSFLEKPCPPQDLVDVVGKALRTRSLVLENRRLRYQLERGDVAERMLFGASEHARALREKVRATARANTEALVTGAPGTGISKVAHVIHMLSRPDQAFEKRAAVSLTPDTTAEALDQAQSGTLFIDEISALTPDTQLSLYEQLESRVDARVLAGSFRNLEEMTKAGAFHPDLFYRISVMRVHIPALSERPEDIPELFRKYVQSACDQAQIAMPDISPDVISRLMSKDWPGNTRDLMNAATRFALGMPDEGGDGPQGLSEQMMQVERSLLIQALQQHSGNATEAAKALKLPRKTFYDKLTRHMLRADAYR